MNYIGRFLRDYVLGVFDGLSLFHLSRDSYFNEHFADAMLVPLRGAIRMAHKDEEV